MIRPYVADDLAAVLDVWEEAARVAHPFLDEQFFADEREQIASTWMPVAETSVHEVDGRVVGFVAMLGNEVGGLFVHPDHQRTGIGRALLDSVRATREFLELDVFERNELGRPFYAEYGFREIGRHVSDVAGEVEVRLRYERVSER